MLVLLDDIAELVYAEFGGDLILLFVEEQNMVAGRPENVV